MKDGSVSIEKGPPKSLKKLLRTMLSELDSLRQQGEEEAVAEDEKADMSSPTTSAAILDAALPVAKTYDNEVRPLLPMTEWTLSDIPESHPPLPPILDPAQEKMALTHQGMVEKNWHRSYEVFEFLGDAFIYHLASEYISQTFPLLSPGRCSQIRERLLRNSNLSLYSLHYGLDKRAKLPAEFKGEGRDGGSRARLEQRNKMYGDLFEAYVGALIRSDPQGVERAQKWLKRLWALTIEKDIREEYQRRDKERARNPSLESSATGPEHTSERPPKLKLIDLIGCKLVKIRYEDAPCKPRKCKDTGLPLFVIDLWVDGWGKSECLGHGSGLSKKDAGSNAAQQALLSTKVLKFYINKKKALLMSEEEQAKRTADL
ncbi:nucleolar rnase [Grosmannia clavigera kw1407]|uniref:Nucleolar rnase n=1 Tax=Grosmannia clavigera (strain kw1407 / UAMH 11150) TaxID=655863 RepID=F0XTH8_GROCL|nr:nucleolar rnase [Grosmannia clavigera kw1407]EFW98974.1 nucleolar rnase [Grosmannia clavigera kw1407]